jgi:predicted component of type VI protein secretion system
MASPAAPSAQTNTVSLSIVQGESANPTATFTQAMAARMVTVGSGATAHWKIRAQGVEALHAEFYWDGNVLWVRNGGSLSGTYVGGNRADDWAQVFDGTEILLGSARIASKVSGPDARNPAGTNPGVSSRNAGYMDEEESTMVFSNNMNLARAAASVPSPPRPATVAPAPPTAQSAPSRGRIGTMAPPMSSSAPAAVSAPRPSAPAPSPARASAPPAPTAAAIPPSPVHEEEPQKPPSSEATVIRPSPYAALEAAGMLGPLPAAGNRNPMPVEQRTIAPGSLNAQSVVVSASAVSLPVVTPQGRPATVAPQVSASLQPVMAPPMSQTAPASSGMSSPGVSSPGSYDDPFGPMDIPPPNGGRGTEKTVAGTSPRTLILAGITLVIGLIAAVLPPPQAQRNARGGNGAPRTQTEVLTTGAAAPTTNNILMLPISDPGLVGVIVPAPIPMADAQGRPRPIPPPNPQDPMKLAAEAVAANRYADAAVLYERLAAEHPEAPLFRQFAAVLRARVASMNCQPGAPGCIPPNSPVPPSAAPRSP